MSLLHTHPTLPRSSEAHPLSEELDRISLLGEADWRALTNASIFLTGGTGFFGTWIVEAFSWANRGLGLNAKLHVLSRNPDAFLAKHPNIEKDQSIAFVQGDVRTFDIGDRCYTHVIHAATATSGPVATDDPEEMFSVITEGTHRVLRSCRDHGITRCLLLSSGAVYGPQPSHMTHVPETWLGGPDQTSASAAYAEGKRAAELLAGIYTDRYGVETPIARCFAFVGPHLPLDVHFAIGNFIADVLAGRSVHVKGDGTPRRSYLHAADLVVWLLALLVRGKGARPYNVGSDVDYSISEIAAAVIAAGHALWPDRPAPQVVVSQTPKPGANVTRYVPDCTRARTELSLPPIIPLHDAILATLRYHSISTRNAPQPRSAVAPLR